MLAGGAVPALAQGVNANCQLDLQGLLQDSIAAGHGISSPDASFVVGYSLSGAPPVICTRPGVGITLPPLTEADPIPGPAAGLQGAGSIDILAAEQSFFLLYQLDGEEQNERVAKRFCHTVGVEGRTDCFILVARPDEPDVPDDPEARRITVTIPPHLADFIAARLGVDPIRIPQTVQVPVGIASQVCPEGADELNDLDTCTAIRTSSSFNNRVRDELT
jgi:hypothetical protein